MGKTIITKEYNKNNKIICNLNVGDHLKRIQGLDYFLFLLKE
jgi:hypothetical protein